MHLRCDGIFKNQFITQSLGLLNSNFFKIETRIQKIDYNSKLVSCSYGTSGGGRASGGVVGGLWWSGPDAAGEECQTCRPGYTRHVIANRCCHLDYASEVAD